MAGYKLQPGEYYEIRFHGTYWTHVKGVTKPYEFKVNMDDHMKEQGFLSCFVRQVLEDPAFLAEARRKYPDWKKYRTHEEDGGEIVRPDGTRAPIQELGLMNRKQLAAYITKKGWDIKCDLYPTAAELKQAVTDFRDHREAFLKFQAKKEASLGPKLKTLASLRSLNSWNVTTFADPLQPEATPTTKAEEAAEELDADIAAYAKDLEDADELQDLLDTV